MPEPDADKLSIKQLAVQWLLTQGVSTVLLFAILATIAYGLPWTYTEFKTWHDASEGRRIEERKGSEDKLLAERKAIAEALLKSTATTSDAISTLANKVSVNSADISKTNDSLKELVSELKKDRIERRDQPKGHGAEPR